MEFSNNNNMIKINKKKFYYFSRTLAYHIYKKIKIINLITNNKYVEVVVVVCVCVIYVFF